MSFTSTIGSATPKPEPFCAARQLGGGERQKVAVQALAGVQPIAQVARENGVSRKFVYAQKALTQKALDEVFAEKGNNDKVLFTLPVTKDWLRKLVLEQILNGHSSGRGVAQIIEDLFPVSLSEGTIHNIVHGAAQRACAVNATEDLSGIKIPALDELFQVRKPVLVGADVNSTYCFLLRLCGGRGETEWGVNLLDLADRGLRPAYSVADFGRGLRAGQNVAWPGVPCHGDVFHVEQDVSELVRYVEHRAYSAVSNVDKVVSAMERAKRKGKPHDLTPRWQKLCAEEAAAVALADDVTCLERWLREDVLALPGSDFKTRGELFDWIMAELRLREAQAPHRIGPLCGKLENGRAAILGFVAVLDRELRSLAQEFQVAEATVRAVHQLQGLPTEEARRWKLQAALWKELGGRFYPLQQALQQRLKGVVRASSIIENLNSRLRCYFFLRRELGPEYLELLRFFLNHRRFRRSQRAERVGRSPYEILTGRPHAHWLELLGYQHAQCAA
jgi:hypothetical protein